MDYNDEFEENEFPKRTDDRYKRIEKFKPYELTHCIVFEMAGRNEEVRKLIQDISNIKLVQDHVRKITTPSIDSLFETGDNETEKKFPDSTLKKYQEYEIIYKDLIMLLKDKYYLYFDQNTVNIPEIENPFKDKDFSGMPLEDIEEEFSDALRSPMMKHISGAVGKFLHGEEYPLYKSDHSIYEGFITARGINPRCKTFDISSINTHFQRKIYDTNQINIALNMSLPEDELVEYIKHIKKTLSDENSKKLKTPNKLLGKDVQEAKKTKNYLIKPTTQQLADMFFVYDYVYSRLKQIEHARNLIDQEYKHNQDQIKNDWTLKDSEKKIQLKELKNEYDGNKVTLGIKDIFKDFDKPMENINFKDSNASKYYYALKPYIEKCRYPEFLTGESIIEDTEDEK